MALTFAPAAVAASGGSAYTPQPTVKSVACVANCAAKKRIQGGSTAKLTGTNLARVTQVVFQGSSRRSAARSKAIKARSARSLLVAVPVNAQTGPVRALGSRGVASPPSKPVKVLPAPAPLAQAHLSPAPGAPGLETATSNAKWYLGAQRGVVFSYRYSGSGGADVSVNLVRQADGAVVQTWRQAQVVPGSVQTVSWRGFGNGVVQPDGRYAFRATVETGGASLSSAGLDDANRDAFAFHRHIFPVRGSHNFGSAGARFGAARSGHTHQGQDVMSRCGTKEVAALGGTVVYSGFQSAAGNYIVIHSLDGTDNAYMHLAQPSPFSEGDKVFTGQQIGVVGETGDASACHLHFEIWTRPGWYNGGHPIDPLPALHAWDAYS